MPGDESARLAALIVKLSDQSQEQLTKQSNKGAFADLTELCIELFPDRVDRKKNGEPVKDDVRRGLLHLFEATGAPTSQGDAERIAERIVIAMGNPVGEHIHLCPLDNAQDFPKLRFGPCEIREFGKAEFEEIIDASRLKRHFPSLKLEAGRFARFHWLVVRERATFAATFGHRSSPWRFLSFAEDYGAIDPFARTWPAIVDQAVLALLLLPLEEMVQHDDVHWRPFRIPWVYTVNGDLLAAPNWPQEADSLHWEPDGYMDEETGEWEETERPFAYPLEEGAEAQFLRLDTGRWDMLDRAQASPIVNPRAAHFLIKAFLSDGMDEFLAHVTTIEAAVGLQTDFPQKGQTRPPALGRGGATDRMAGRVAGLLNNPGAEEEFWNVFNLRSAYVHGRTTPVIRSPMRIQARKLARRVVDALVTAADGSGHPGRTEFLSNFCP
jgi:hypothetical protein